MIFWLNPLSALDDAASKEEVWMYAGIYGSHVFRNSIKEV
jgi:hypothetical protein